MAEIKLDVTKRVPSTKGTLNQLRRDGKVPGVFYIKGQDTLLFTAEVADVKPLVYTAENNVIDLSIDGQEPLTCIVKDVQFDPVSENIEHIDLLGLTKGQEITIQVPVVLKGHSVGVKAGGNLVLNLNKLDVRCLPRHIPEHLEIDITNLNVGQAIRVRDLSYENLTITSAENLSVVSVVRSRVMDNVAVEEQAEAPTEPEVIGSTEEEE